MSGSLQSRLFGKNRFFTLPAGADFLGALSDTLIEITDARNKPEALSDVLIFVPNRRSARALAGRLFEGLGGQAILPPDIRPLGDAGDNDPALLGELASVDARPPMPPGARLGALARLVNAWHTNRGETITSAAAVAIAQKLAQLLDQAALAGQVEWEKLTTLLDGSDLAQHWQVSVDFMSIVMRLWPELLDENGFSDTNEQDRLAAEAMCARWERSPPDTPVLIVGSTGSTPATRLLMQAAVKLPKGLVLFPGLDMENDAITWQNILEAPSHPQHAFADTMQALGYPMTDIAPWPGFENDPTRLARRQLIQESLAPADMTADWVARLERRAAPLSREALTRQGIAGLSLIEAETEAEEADVIALLLREQIEEPNKTAALITPDAGLARRVSALLKQWGVDVLPSAGTPLTRTRAGSYLFRVLDFCLDPGDPVALAALLKHELTFILEEEEKDAAISALERGVLRGLRRWGDLSDLDKWANSLEERDKEGSLRLNIPADELILAHSLLAELEERCQPFLDRVEALRAAPFSLRTFAELLAELADTLTRHSEDENPSLLWSGEDGAASARFLEDAALFGDWMDPLSLHDLQPVLSTLCQNINVPPDKPGHPGIHIWGPLEARLQSCDLVILGSLNEGSWPEPPGADGFIPRHIRNEIGLPDTEARIGLSAHDFAQLVCSERVVMTRAMRVENKPSVASRWLWRLRILASGALESLDKTDELLAAGASKYLRWARERQTANSLPTIAAPKPRPPVEARPKRINVTDVSRLIRDPYAYYARHVLKLKKLEPLNAPLGPREIGIAMHRALEDKDTKSKDGVSSRDLLDAFEVELTAVGGDKLFFVERENLWRKAALAYVGWAEARDNLVSRRYFETDYACDIDTAFGVVTLHGRADLVESLRADALAITDFKTGKPPTEAQVSSGLEPQLPLLAILAEKGSAKGGPNGKVSELFYFGFGSGAGVKPLSPKTGDLAGLILESEAGFRRLMESYLQPEQPYLSGPRVQFASKYGDYDRLARRAEWADAGAEPGGDG